MLYVNKSMDGVVAPPVTITPETADKVKEFLVKEQVINVLAINNATLYNEKINSLTTPALLVAFIQDNDYSIPCALSELPDADAQVNQKIISVINAIANNEPVPSLEGGAPRRRRVSSSSEASSDSDDLSSSSVSSDSDDDDSASESSVSTTELLGKDPLFLVLSQYFMTSSGKNIADVLEEISLSLKKGVRVLKTIQRSL